MELGGLATGLGFVVGALLIVGALLALVLTVVGIALALIFFKTRQILIPGVTLFILNLLETPIRYLLWMLRVEEDIVPHMMVEVRNRLYKRQFEKTPYVNRAVFLPQCLRNPQCPAPLTPEGIKCLNCGRCGIGMIKEVAEQLGYKFFIAPGSSLIKRMVSKYRPKAILGVGCNMEVKEGTAKMASYGLPVQGITLERDGCVDTRVDVVKLMEKLKSHSAYGKYSIAEDPDYLRRAVEISEMWSDSEPTGVEIIEAKKGVERGRW